MIDRTLGRHYECEFASSVSQAREKLLSGTFHLALCDIQMPGESGLVLAEEIIRDRPQTAVVLITGEDDPEVAEHAFSFGVHGYLVKPFWPGQLRITTMNALRRHELELAQKAHSKTLEARLQKLMDQAPVPIYIKDRDGRYILANQVANEVAGLHSGDLVGLTDEAIMSPEGAHHAQLTDAVVLERGETYAAEETIVVGGEEAAFLTVKFPYIDDQGEVIGVTGISADITAQKQAERLHQDLAAVQKKAIEDLRASRQETVERLAKAIELRDASTGQHVSRMAIISAFLGSQLGLDADRVALLRSAAPMHDVGKIATPDEILNKPGSLSAAEREEMERHTVTGHEILSNSESKLLQIAATIALTHHEYFDGRGYPKGLAGDAIPFEGRIAAVADVFDALLSDRCYRPRYAVGEAVRMMKEGRGTHFDPRIVDVLLEHLEEVLSLRGKPSPQRSSV